MICWKGGLLHGKKLLELIMIYIWYIYMIIIILHISRMKFISPGVSWDWNLKLNTRLIFVPVMRPARCFFHSLTALWSLVAISTASWSSLLNDIVWNIRSHSTLTTTSGFPSKSGLNSSVIWFGTLCVSANDFNLSEYSLILDRQTGKKGSSASSEKNWFHSSAVTGGLSITTFTCFLFFMTDKSATFPTVTCTNIVK